MGRVSWHWPGASYGWIDRGTSFQLVRSTRTSWKLIPRPLPVYLDPLCSNLYNCDLIFIAYRTSWTGSYSIQLSASTLFSSFGNGIGFAQEAPPSRLSTIPAFVNTNRCLPSLPKIGP